MSLVVYGSWGAVPGNYTEFAARTLEGTSCFAVIPVAVLLLVIFLKGIWTLIKDVNYWSAKLRRRSRALWGRIRTKLWKSITAGPEPDAEPDSLQDRVDQRAGALMRARQARRAALTQAYTERFGNMTFVPDDEEYLPDWFEPPEVPAMAYWHYAPGHPDIDMEHRCLMDAYNGVREGFGKCMAVSVGTDPYDEPPEPKDIFYRAPSSNMLHVRTCHYVKKAVDANTVKVHEVCRLCLKCI